MDETIEPGLVSVVIPSYNYGAFIGAAIDSVLDQSYDKVEVVVVDDSSTDDTRQVVEKYLVDNRVRYLWQDNAGVSAARNHGMQASRGEFMAFLDADDSWPQRDMLTAGVKYLNENPAVGWLFGDAQPFDKNGIADMPYLQKGGYYGCASDLIEVRTVTPADLCNNDKFFIPTGTIIARRRCFDEAGLFDTSLKMFEDTDMWLRMIRFPVAFLPQVLLARRLHESNTSNARWAYLDDLKKLVDRYRLEEHGVTFSFHAARGHYLAGRHWMAVGDYVQARNAFRNALRYKTGWQTGWKPALYLAYTTFLHGYRKLNPIAGKPHVKDSHQ